MRAQHLALAASLAAAPTNIVEPLAEFPPKGLLRMNSPAFLEERRQALELYFSALLNHPQGSAWLARAVFRLATGSDASQFLLARSVHLTAWVNQQAEAEVEAALHLAQQPLELLPGNSLSPAPLTFARAVTLDVADSLFSGDSATVSLHGQQVMTLERISNKGFEFYREWMLMSADHQPLALLREARQLFGLRSKLYRMVATSPDSEPTAVKMGTVTTTQYAAWTNIRVRMARRSPPASSTPTADMAAVDKTDDHKERESEITATPGWFCYKFAAHGQPVAEATRDFLPRFALRVQPGADALFLTMLLLALSKQAQHRRETKH